MQQDVQTDATCNIQQCWEFLVNNVASVCTQPKSQLKLKNNAYAKFWRYNKEYHGLILKKAYSFIKNKQVKNHEHFTITSNAD